MPRRSSSDENASNKPCQSIPHIPSNRIAFLQFARRSSTQSRYRNFAKDARKSIQNSKSHPTQTTSFVSPGSQPSNPMTQTGPDLLFPLHFPYFSTLSSPAAPLHPYLVAQNVYYQFQNTGQCKNMFKVVLVLKQFSVRLKQCQLDIILRKNKENVTLCSKLPLLNGHCHINLVKEFYIDFDDLRVVLLFYLFQGSERRYGGEIPLNVFQWEQNVIHSTQTKITNSPDRNSLIKYEFYYFKDEKNQENRALLEAKEKRRLQYNLIENQNKELSKEKLKLEEQVFIWHKKNEQLENGRHDMLQNMTERENYHNNQKGSCQYTINHYSSQFQREKEKRQGLKRLVDYHGLGQRDGGMQEQ